MQTLGSDWRMYTKKDTKKGGYTDGRFQPLGQIKWHRVILDVSAYTYAMLLVHYCWICISIFLIDQTTACDVIQSIFNSCRRATL